MHGVLVTRARSLGEASFAGKLYHVRDYPGAIASDDPADRLAGELFLVEEQEGLWPRLDAYEGIGPAFEEPFEYERRKVRVHAHNGEEIEAYIYLYTYPVEGLEQIPHGDYCKAMAG